MTKLFHQVQSGEAREARRRRREAATLDPTALQAWRRGGFEKKEEGKKKDEKKGEEAAADHGGENQVTLHDRWGPCNDPWGLGSMALSSRSLRPWSHWS